MVIFDVTSRVPLKSFLLATTVSTIFTTDILPVKLSAFLFAINVTKAALTSVFRIIIVSASMVSA